MTTSLTLRRDGTLDLGEPLWNGRRVEKLLHAHYGLTPGGGYAHAAKDLGLRESTLRTYIRKGAPPRQQAMLAGACGPSEKVLAAEAQRLAVTRGQVDSLRRWGPASVPGSWHRQGWLNEHVVLVTAHSYLPTMHVRVRTPPGARERLPNESILEKVSLPTRPQAVAAAYRLLAELRAWRVIPAPGVIRRGDTLTVLDDAPTGVLPVAVHLEQTRRA